VGRAPLPGADGKPARFVAGRQGFLCPSAIVASAALDAGLDRFDILPVTLVIRTGTAGEPAIAPQ